MKSIALLGQSNQSHFWEVPVSGLTPLSNTFWWTTGWVPPVNSLINFCNALKIATNDEVRVLPGAVGSTFLVPEVIPSGVLHANWLDEQDTVGPLYKFKQMLQACGAELSAVWWVQGENDAWWGATTEQYLSGLAALRGIISRYAGKRPQDIAFYVSPLGAWGNVNVSPTWTGQQVRAAQLQADSVGWIVGPDYFDLPDDGVHLTTAGMETFAKRGAAMFSASGPKIIAATYDEAAGSVVVTVDQPLAANAAPTGFEVSQDGFASVLSATASVAGNQITLVVPGITSLPKVRYQQQVGLALGSPLYGLNGYPLRPSAAVACALKPKVQTSSGGGGGSGVVVKVMKVETGLGMIGPCAVNVPYNGTAPLATQGDIFLTTPAHTPTNTGNWLDVDVEATLGASGNTWLVPFLLRDAGATAIKATQSFTVGANDTINFHFSARVPAGALPTVFKLAAGGNAPGIVTYCNRNSFGQILGGVCATSIKVTEVIP